MVIGVDDVDLQSSFRAGPYLTSRKPERLGEEAGEHRPKH